MKKANEKITRKCGKVGTLGGTIVGIMLRRMRKTSTTGFSETVAIVCETKAIMVANVTQRDSSKVEIAVVTIRLRRIMLGVQMILTVLLL